MNGPLNIDDYYEQTAISGGYCRLELFNYVDTDLLKMSSEFDLYPAPFGGPIACVQRRDTGTGRRAVVFLAASGHQMVLSNSRICQIAHEGRLIYIGWTEAEQLVTVGLDGLARVFDAVGQLQFVVQLGEDTRTAEAASCRSYRSGHLRTGLCLMTKLRHFYTTNHICEGARVRRLPDVAELTGSPDCWVTFCQPNKDLATVLVCSGQQTFLVSSEYGSRKRTMELQRPFERFLAASVSFDGSHLALLADNGILWLGRPDFSLTACELDSGHVQAPRIFAWMANDAICAQWDDGDSLELVDWDTGQQNYNDADAFARPLAAVTEPDGLRLVYNTGMTLVQRMPKCIDDALRPLNFTPAAWLKEAYKFFVQRDQQAHEYMLMIKEQEPAIRGCLESALHMWPADLQKQMLRTANFGRAFAFSDESSQVFTELFVNASRQLRVLNSVRRSAGIGLTHEQFRLLGTNCLLDRLVTRKLYYLAFNVGCFLKLPDAVLRILERWAFDKVGQNELDPGTICKQIFDRFEALRKEVAEPASLNSLATIGGNAVGGLADEVSFSRIAQHAIHLGRDDLAAMLLDLEPRFERKVPLLLELGQHKQALERAVASCDADLVNMVILRMKQDNIREAQIVQWISETPMAKPLFIGLSLEFAETGADDDAAYLYGLFDDRRAKGVDHVRQLFSKPDGFQTFSGNLAAKTAKLRLAEQELRGTPSEWAAQAIDTECKLLVQQDHWRSTGYSGYVGLSVAETLKMLVGNNQMKQFDQLVKELKVPEKVAWHCKVAALAANRNWAELERLATSRKPPIGYEPFIDGCLKAGNHIEARKYQAKLLPNEKVKGLVKLDLLGLAAEAAIHQRDEDNLRYVERKIEARLKSAHASQANELRSALNRVVDCLQRI